MGRKRGFEEKRAISRRSASRRSLTTRVLKKEVLSNLQFSSSTLDETAKRAVSDCAALMDLGTKGRTRGRREGPEGGREGEREIEKETHHVLPSSSYS